MARIFHVANDSWTLAPMGKPGSHFYATCGRARDIKGKEVIILAGSSSTTVEDSKSSHILDIEVIELSEFAQAEISRKAFVQYNLFSKTKQKSLYGPQITLFPLT